MSDDGTDSITLAGGQRLAWDACDKDFAILVTKPRRRVELQVDWDDVDHDAVKRDLAAMLNDLTAAGWKVRIR